jgi:hypothetical protein
MVDAGDLRDVVDVVDERAEGGPRQRWLAGAAA